MPPPTIQSLRFFGHWLNSIAVHAHDAPVLLVGTHKDQLQNESESLKEAQEILANFLGTLPVTLRGILQRIARPESDEKRYFFAVNNIAREIIAGKERAKDRSVSDIRKALERVVSNDKREVKGLSFLQF